jgi:hypothetical protein
MPDEVARIGALSNGSNGQRSLESASLHFERYCGRERGVGRARVRTRNPEPKAKDMLFEPVCGRSEAKPSGNNWVPRHAALACWDESPHQILNASEESHGLSCSQAQDNDYSMPTMASYRAKCSATAL